jgi:hypothetical protein
VAGTYQDGYLAASGGAVYEATYLSLSSVVLWDNNKSLDLQTGFTVSFAELTLFYNYRFNLLSGNEYLPLSLMHQTGLSVRLNKIEKRNNISTIILPKL